MARTISQIQQSIIDAKNADPVLSLLLTSTSNVAIWTLWTYIVAVCQWTLENLFDQHVAEVDNIIATMKPHTLQWYATMAKAFQFGYSLPADSDTYDNTGIDPSVIATSQVVNYAAATELPKTLRIKVATTTAGALAPLSGTQLTAFTAYMNVIKDAGVRLQITSGNPDSLRLSIDVYYDALVLDNTGARLDGTENTPVQDAINTFLQNLPFNGLFVVNYLVAYLNAVSGVVNADVKLVQANFGALPYTAIDPEYQPDAGYLRIINPSDLTINFIAHAPI